MMKKRVAFILAMSVCFAVFARGAKDKKNEAVYTFGGSSTLAPIIHAAIPQFESEHEGVKITYETTGSSVGIKNLISGVFSLAGSSRELKNSEIASGCKKIPIALDGLTVAVNESVGISNLSMEELAKIFTKEITNWKDVGGLDTPIEIIVRDETSGTYGSFTEIVIASQLGKGVEQSRNAIIARENGEVAAKIACTPGSIGYIGMGFSSIVKNKGGKELSIDGVYPTIKNIHNGSYKLSRSLYLITMNTGSLPLEEEFISYIQSSYGQEIVAEKQFIPLQ